MLQIWSLVSLYYEMIRLGVFHIPYSVMDAQGLLLASEQNTEYKAFVVQKFYT